MTRDALFDLRWRRGLRSLTGPLTRLYGDDPTLVTRLREMLKSASDARPADLAELDLRRDLDPDWFLSSDMVGYVFYIDRFCGTVDRVPAHIPYLKSLGVSYAHMMPCLMPRPEPSDGGYAVMDYRRLNPALGTMDQLEATCRSLRAAGISPCIDMVLNHTAMEHDWAEKARAGDPFYRDFYLMYPDRTLPDAYEATLTEVFPDQAPGNFTWDDDADAWVWTTFNTYQWDLNWANPEVFLAILDTMLFLVNRGVEVLRLDAVAFMWKRMGTTCQNLPEVHDILQLLAQAMRIAAPGTLHKAEAIVAPGDLVPYLGRGMAAGKASHLAYHNSLMVQFWSSLAARDTRLMRHVLSHHFPDRFARAGWATYLRCHDDIGWAITEEDTAHVPPMSGPGHRAFLADWYNGTFPASFSRGADFQVNEETGDRRTNGTLASLAGLEAARQWGDAEAENAAIARILMGHALIASYGGMPLLYMGDEIGMTNDLSYLDDPAKAVDGRWMQRPEMDWDTALHPEGAAARILTGIRHIMDRRRAVPQLSAEVPTRIATHPDRALLIFERAADDTPMICVFNFTGSVREVTPWSLGLDPARAYRDALAGAPLTLTKSLILVPAYAALWLIPDRALVDHAGA